MYIAIWSSVEPGLGITLVSLATLRPLFRSLLGRGTSKNSNGQSPKKTGTYATPKIVSRSKGADAKYGPGFEFDMLDDVERLRGYGKDTGNVSVVEAGHAIDVSVFDDSNRISQSESSEPRRARRGTEGGSPTGSSRSEEWVITKTTEITQGSEMQEMSGRGKPLPATPKIEVSDSWIMLETCVR